MRKRRILFIDGPLGGGGAERVLIDILRNFDYSRFEVDLAVICRRGVLMGEVPPEVNVIELWDGYTWDYKLAYRLSKWLHCNCLFSRKMNGRSLRHDYDVEISFLEGMPLKLGSLRTTDAKKITWVHADLYNHRYETTQFFTGEEQRDYNRMDKIVCVSNNCRNAFMKRFPDSAVPIVIHNPIDIEKIKRLADEEILDLRDNDGRLEIISVGRLNEAKNPVLFLQVARMAKKQGLPVKFKWVGDGDQRKHVEQLIADWGLQDTVTLTGFVKNPYPHIKHADIMLITSKYESFCLVACEAMILGTPVISTATAGTSEIIGNNEYGAISDHTPQSLFKILKKWIDNPNIREYYQRRASNKFENYTIKNVLDSIYEILPM